MSSTKMERACNIIEHINLLTNRVDLYFVVEGPKPHLEMLSHRLKEAPVEKRKIDACDEGCSRGLGQQWGISQLRP